MAHGPIRLGRPARTMAPRSHPPQTIPLPKGAPTWPRPPQSIPAVRSKSSSRCNHLVLDWLISQRVRSPSQNFVALFHPCISFRPFLSVSFDSFRCDSMPVLTLREDRSIVLQLPDAGRFGQPVFDKKMLSNKIVYVDRVRWCVVLKRL